MGLASPRSWPRPARTAEQQIGPREGRDVCRIALAFFLGTLMFGKSDLSEKFFLVTRLIEYSESLGHSRFHQQPW